MTEIYRITITHIRDEETLTSRAWTKIAENENGTPEYGHPPQVKQVQSVARDVYQQEVEARDGLIQDVVAAVNKGQS